MEVRHDWSVRYGSSARLAARIDFHRGCHVDTQVRIRVEGNILVVEAGIDIPPAHDHVESEDHQNTLAEELEIAHARAPHTQIGRPPDMIRALLEISLSWVRTTAAVHEMSRTLLHLHRHHPIQEKLEIDHWNVKQVPGNHIAHLVTSHAVVVCLTLCPSLVPLEPCVALEMQNDLSTEYVTALAGVHDCLRFGLASVIDLVQSPWDHQAVKSDARGEVTLDAEPAHAIPEAARSVLEAARPSAPSLLVVGTRRA